MAHQTSENRTRQSHLTAADPRSKLRPVFSSHARGSIKCTQVKKADTNDLMQLVIDSSKFSILDFATLALDKAAANRELQRNTILDPQIKPMR